MSVQASKELSNPTYLLHRTKVAMGSTNQIKVQAAKNVLEPENMQVIPCQADSAVRHQPLHDEETLQGAINRAKDCLGKTDAQLAIGLEAGIVFLKGQAFLSHWGALVNRYHNVYFTNAPLILLPNSYIAPLLAGRSLEEIMQDFTGIEKLGTKEGAIGVFTQKHLNREQVLTQLIKVLIGEYRYYQA